MCDGCFNALGDGIGLRRDHEQVTSHDSATSAGGHTMAPDRRKLRREMESATDAIEGEGEGGGGANPSMEA